MENSILMSFNIYMNLDKRQSEKCVTQPYVLDNCEEVIIFLMNINEIYI